MPDRSELGFVIRKEQTVNKKTMGRDITMAENGDPPASFSSVVCSDDRRRQRFETSLYS